MLSPSITRPDRVRDLITQLRVEGIGILLISHDIHDVFDLADRISLTLQGKLVGTVNKSDVTKDEVLAMIIMARSPRTCPVRTSPSSTVVQKQRVPGDAEIPLRFVERSPLPFPETAPG